MLRNTLLTFVSLSALVSSEISLENGAPTVILANNALISGVIKNSREGKSFYSFTGIPYGIIPKRFQAAQLIVEPWEGMKYATEEGEICTQKAVDTLGDTIGGEDCLNLNVYIPVLNSNKTEDSYPNGLPILVWIHGGGFSFGDAVTFSGPKYFMDEPVILVTFNYRLGVFGFLSTGDDVIPGNNGLKDQVLAFKWIQKNIKEFGGDPNKVTIFGVSAGGASVHYHLLSPLSKGLFHRAIIQSGSALAFWAYKEKSKDEAVKLATFLNCSHAMENSTKITSQEILECFQNLTADELNTAQFAFKSSWPANLRSFNFAPVAETSSSSVGSGNQPFLTESPMELISRGKYASKVPLIIGSSEDEGATLFAGAVLRDQVLLNELNSNWDLVAPKAMGYDVHYSPEQQNQISGKLRKLYFGNKTVSQDTVDNLTDFYTDQILHPVYNAALAYVMNGNPVYLYQFAYPGQVSFMGLAFNITGNLSKKVAHSDEVQYLFDIPILGGLNLLKSGSSDEKFSKNLVHLWASFAEEGRPKHLSDQNPKWETISKNEYNGLTPLKWYRLEENPHYIYDPYEKRVTALDVIFADYYKHKIF
ncbi:unnamed protein product [Orchesella dallaii]|uniref:Carboxylic ester hydrolase n=1 Tax=Orchesella dallaii TaxID=48710 RepID=A0ABP1PP26_9HEXA